MRRSLPRWLSVVAASVLSGALASMLQVPLVQAQESARSGSHHRAVQLNQDDSAADATPDDIWAWRETWTGSEKSGNTLSVYTGATMAVGGSILNENGWRLRSLSGHGRSQYPGVKWIGGHAYPVTVHAQNNFSDLLAGYQWGSATRFGHLTVKAFGGLAIESQRASPSNAIAARSLRYGAKGAVETWLDISDRTWLSVDASIGSARRAFAGRARYGWRIIPGLSIGPEAGVGGNEGDGAGRAGAFARFEWGAGDWWSGEVSAAAGMSTNTISMNNIGSAPLSRGDPYANISLLLRY